MARIQRADWATWKHIPTVDLWQAVALSLEIEPHPDRVLEVLRSEPMRGDVGAASIREFQRRLRIAQANVSMTGPLVPELLFQGVFDSPFAAVSFAKFATWARSIPFDPLPEWFPAGGEGAGG